MQHLRDVVARATRPFVMVGAAVWLALSVAVAATAVSVATLDADSGVHRPAHPTRPHLEHTRGHYLRAPADAIVEPSAERWQQDAVPVAGAPQISNVTGRVLRLDTTHGTITGAPCLVRSFPRPPPTRF